MTSTHTTIESPLGDLTLIRPRRRVDRRLLPRPLGTARSGDTRQPGRSPASSSRQRSSPSTRRRARLLELATATSGDRFQQRVWRLIDEIPYGETTTYGELARELGDPSLARAVGSAVGRNPLSVIVPCHRVVGKDGELTGYAGGLERKRFLLDLEAAAGVVGGTPSRLF